VNAVNFSQNGGRWLASGGDDLRILLWDMHNIETPKPIHTFVGPTVSLLKPGYYLFDIGNQGNIFELAFTAANSHLLWYLLPGSYNFIRLIIRLARVLIPL
jgi:DDB1- and CUL4-associated factor 5